MSSSIKLSNIHNPVSTVHLVDPANKRKRKLLTDEGNEPSKKQRTESDSSQKVSQFLIDTEYPTFVFAPIPLDPTQKLSQLLADSAFPTFFLQPLPDSSSNRNLKKSTNSPARKKRKNVTNIDVDNEILKKQQKINPSLQPLGQKEIVRFCKRLEKYHNNKWKKNIPEIAAIANGLNAKIHFYDERLFFIDNAPIFTCDTITDAFALIQSAGILSRDAHLDLLALKISESIKNNGIKFNEVSITEAVEDFTAIEKVANNANEKLRRLKGTESVEYFPVSNPRYSTDNPNNPWKNLVITETSLSFLGKKAVSYFTECHRLRSFSHKNFQNDIKAILTNDNHLQAAIRKVLNRILYQKGFRKFVGTAILKELELSAGTSSHFRSITLPLVIDLLERQNKQLIGKSWKVLDPCGGWGDRLLGGMADRRITHLAYNDTNKEMLPDIIRMFNTLANIVDIAPKFLFTTSYPAEELDPLKLTDTYDRFDGQFDLVFTSPPYFEGEIYEGEANADKNLRKKIKITEWVKSYYQWRKKFLYKVIQSSHLVLKPGGYLAINIDDVAMRRINKELKLEKNPDAYRIADKKLVWDIKEKMCEYAEKVNFIFIGVMPLGTAKGSGFRSTIPKTEPIFIFRKRLLQEFV
jgi:DNA methylase